MIERYIWAKSRPIERNFKRDWRETMGLPTKGLVIHISGGTSLSDIQGTFNTPAPPPGADGKKKFGVSAHFGIGKDGDVWQFLSFRHRAQAVGGDDDTDGKWLSVENVARAGEKLTEEQIEECAWLLAWLSKTFSFQLQLATNRNEQGLGYHKMFGNTDHDCPGSAVIGQLPEILEKAKTYKEELSNE